MTLRHWNVAGALGMMAAGLLAAGCQSRGPRFAVGLYDVPASRFPEIAAAGFNTVVAPASAEVLDAARRNDLQVIASIPASPGGIRAVKDHPALWGWYLKDEPDLHRVSPAKVGAMRRDLRQSSRKPSLVVLMSGSAAERYRDTADFIGVDWYPVPWGPVATVSREMRLARVALAGRPFFAILQAFDWTSFPELVRTDTPLRPPKPEELRCMAFLALMQGASGLFFYTYDHPRWRLHEQPELWSAVQEIAREAGRLAPVFKERILWWPLQSVTHGPPAEMYNEIMEARIQLSLFRLRKAEGGLEPGYYLFAANTSAAPSDFSFNLPFAGVRRFNTSCPPGEITTEGTWLRKTYAPFEVCIFGPIDGTLLD